jgi:hypothetical protein
VTPRGVALGLGIAFALLTALELIVGKAALGDVELLRRTTKINILHWATALAMLGAFFAGNAGISRVVMRVAGAVLLILALWGVIWADELGAFLGFVEGMPAIYNGVHGLAGLLALSVGFLRSPRTA